LVEGLGFPLQLLVEVGLLAPSKIHSNGGNRRPGAPNGQQQQYYERFQGRLMVPIRDVQGRVVAFGGRSVANESEEAFSTSYVPSDCDHNNDDLDELGGSNAGELAEAAEAKARKNPKYLNSPETTEFHKRETLFGLSEAKKAIRAADCAVLVEGYFDVLALHELTGRRAEKTNGSTPAPPSATAAEGFGLGCAPNACGVMGTALTAAQVLAAARFSASRRVVLCLDGDAAGLRAVERACEDIFPALLGGGDGCSRDGPNFEYQPEFPLSSKLSSSSSFSSSGGAGGRGLGSRLQPVEVRIASLPSGFKDPSDLLNVIGASGARAVDAAVVKQLRSLLEEAETAGGAGCAKIATRKKQKKTEGSKSGDGAGHDDDEAYGLGARVFQEAVIGRAEAWTEWYAKRIVFADQSEGGTEQNDANSFSRKVNKLTDLIASLPSSADRTFHAFRFAEMLAAGNLPYQQQLEQDLASVAAQKHRQRLQSEARAASRQQQRHWQRQQRQRQSPQQQQHHHHHQLWAARPPVAPPSGSALAQQRQPHWQPNQPPQPSPQQQLRQTYAQQNSYNKRQQQWQQQPPQQPPSQPQSTGDAWRRGGHRSLTYNEPSANGRVHSPNPSLAPQPPRAPRSLRRPPPPQRQASRTPPLQQPSSQYWQPTEQQQQQERQQQHRHPAPQLSPPPQQRRQQEYKRKGDSWTDSDLSDSKIPTDWSGLF
jgi:hypothetical protein